MEITMVRFGPLAFVFLAGLLFPRCAHAYLDPGTGSYVLQILLAAFLGASVALKIYWKKVTAFLRSPFNRRPHDGDGGH
jgi:hypothetical protein